MDTLPFGEYQKLDPLFGEDLYDEIKLETCVAKRISAGGTGPQSVKAQLQFVGDFLKAATK